MGIHRDALGGVEQQVLQGRGGGVLAANARHNASRSRRFPRTDSKTCSQLFSMVAAFELGMTATIYDLTISG